MNSSGASASTANHEQHSVSVALIGCHRRTDTKGTTPPSRRTCGQLCTRLRFGKAVAADTMNRHGPTKARCSGVHTRSMRSTISGG